MTAVSAPRPGWELLARQVNQRRYEALRAYLYEGASLQQAADRAGDTRAALASLERDLRAGKLTVFAPPGVPGRKSAPKKDAARARVIELRREGALPRHPRGDHQRRRRHHHQDQPPHLLTRPPRGRPARRHRRPLVGRTPAPLRIRLTKGRSTGAEIRVRSRAHPRRSARLPYLRSALSPHAEPDDLCGL
jgi:hypothetical protein